MPNEKKGAQVYNAHNGPVVEERLLHSHHRDKKMKASSLQAADSKSFRSKNPERHHRKSIEEEMHLRPLNERHHKFPNPALLDKIDDGNPPDPQITSKNLINQAKHGRANNHRRLHGRRQKRNRSEQKTLALLDNNSEISTGNQKPKKPKHTTKKPNILDLKDTQIQDIQNPKFENSGFPSKISSYW
ncbi:uncharacterized protein TNCT_222421 [Trichonephila clavata]|uniref:Uncharacterized protein n=1 Tax=Trichonephila clavata TaxID=2740835 RepID=A0A8X6L9I8_TRICU|nr:uncharacterized protein TNCT_222421 [Trichonephila clavata]